MANIYWPTFHSDNQTKSDWTLKFEPLRDNKEPSRL